MKKLIACLCLTLSLCLCAFGCADTTTEYIKIIDVELTTETYAFAIAKGNTTLKEAVNELLTEKEADGSLDALINSYFDGTATFTHENPASKEGCFVVATNAWFPPFEYFVGNKFAGVDIEIASLIAEKLGKPLYVVDMAFDSVIPSVTLDASSSNYCDIGMAGLTVNEKRLETVDFSDGYYASAQVLIVSSDNTDFDSCKTAADVEEVLATKSKAFTVGAQSGTTGYMYSFGNADFGYDGFTNLTTNEYDYGALAALDLKNGKIQGVIIDKQPALSITANINK